MDEEILTQDSTQTEIIDSTLEVSQAPRNGLPRPHEMNLDHPDAVLPSVEEMEGYFNEWSTSWDIDNPQIDIDSIIGHFHDVAQLRNVCDDLRGAIRNGVTNEVLDLVYKSFQNLANDAVQLLVLHLRVLKETQASETDTLATTSKYNKLNGCIYYSHLHLYSHLQLALTKSEAVASADSDHMFCYRFMPITYEGNTPLQNLMLYLYTHAREKRLRKKDGMVHKLIYTPDGHRTIAYAAFLKTSDWVQEHTQRHINYEMWQFLTIGKNFSQVVDHLNNLQDLDLPFLKNDRFWYSFRNGCYNLKQPDKFYRYGVDPIPKDAVACKHYDEDFIHSETLDWEDPSIECPHFESLLDYQEFDNKLKYNIYAYFGKCLYINNPEPPYTSEDGDNYQVLMMLKGVAKSGKSTLIQALSYCYDLSDIAWLSNNQELKFGLDTIIDEDKRIILSYELKGNFAEHIDEAELQSIIEGTRIKINIKNQKAEIRKNNSCVIFATNEPPNVKDRLQSMSRRYWIVEFTKPITSEQTDTELSKKLFQEVASGKLIQKFNLAYRKFRSEVGNGDPWDHVADEIWQNRNAMEKETSVLLRFLASGLLEFHESYYTKYPIFINQLCNFAEMHGEKRMKITDQVLEGPFKMCEHNLSLSGIGIERPWPLDDSGKTEVGRWVEGCRFISRSADKDR